MAYSAEQVAALKDEDLLEALVNQPSINDEKLVRAWRKRILKLQGDVYIHASAILQNLVSSSMRRRFDQF